MEIKPLESKQFDKVKSKLLRFAVRFGERRITARALQALLQLNGRQLNPASGTSVVIGVDRSRLAGISVVVDHGDTASFVVIHPAYRGQSLGTTLLREQINRHGRLICRVAADNSASQTMCTRAGMSVIGIDSEPAGKVTIRFARNH